MSLWSVSDYHHPRFDVPLLQEPQTKNMDAAKHCGPCRSRGSSGTPGFIRFSGQLYSNRRVDQAGRQTLRETFKS